ncbi:MAG: hypothetical protein ACKVS6_08715 [Planctomycetota bacterium]
MAAKDIEILTLTIEAMTARRDDLKQAAKEERPEDEIRRILNQRKFINFEIVQLESVRDDIEASLITVAPPAAKDIKEMKDSIEVLGESIAADQEWAAIFEMTTKILDAAKAIEGNIRKRQK